MESAPTREMFLAALDGAGELVLPLRGASMGASWRECTAVVVRSARVRPPRWGDVVVFERHGRWYAHRMIGRAGPRCWTKGDARWAWDRPAVLRGQIVGVAVAVVEGATRRPMVSSRLAALWQLARALAAWPFL